MSTPASSTPATTLDQLRAGFAAPAPEAAPMVRWWWFGPSVERAEIDRELAEMAAVGLGGVEVAYVYPLVEESGTFLDAEFLADLRHAAETARGLGLRFDLTLGSGWSFGGPHVTPEHAARKLVWERRELSPGPADIPVVAAWPGDELVAAYLGPGSLQEPPDELTRLPVVDGVLQVPDGTGTRQVLLARAQLTGQNVKRAARGAEGPVLDHYSAGAAREHLRRVGEPLLAAVPGHLLGSVFCDSLEVYGSDWTPDLAAEFHRRRGYDLLPDLYRLVVDGPGATRLRADYHRTLCELYEENFVAVLQQWAAGHGVPFRIQGYGTPPATISSYRHADLFEGEGWGWTELTQTRWASSAAHAYGLPVVSSETWTWVHSPSYRATPLDLQGEAHEHLLAGINQLIGHGWPYSPSGRAGSGEAPAEGLGWFFYAAGALDDRNPWWPAMPGLVRYLTRLCWLLRQGEPVVDVLLHVSSEDVFARLGTGTGGSLDAWKEARQLLGEVAIPAVRRSGRDYDLLDDELLDRLPPGETRPVVVAGATTVSAGARNRLEQHLAAGGTVLTVGAAAAIAGAVDCDGPGLVERLDAVAVPTLSLDPGVLDVGVVRRRTAEADLCLVVNTGPAVQTVALRHQSTRRGFEQWDAHTGGVVRVGAAGPRIEVELQPYEATVLVLTDHEPAPSAVPQAARSGTDRRQPLDGGWQVRFDDEEPVDVELPHVWEADPGRGAWSGRAAYVRTFDLGYLPPTGRVEVDLGPTVPVPEPAASADPHGLTGHSFRARVDPPVGVVAEVRLNGVPCGVRWAPPYVVDVTEAVRRGDNRLEVVVSNTAANALAADEHVAAVVAASERRHGRRFRMQELERAMDGVRSGLLAVPTLVRRD